MDYTKRLLEKAEETADKKRLKKLRDAFPDEVWERFHTRLVEGILYGPKKERGL